MNIKRDKNEVWYWYETINQFESSGMPLKEFCAEYKVDYRKLCNMRYRLIYKRDTNPELYAKLLTIGRKFSKSGIPVSKFAKDNGVEVRWLSEVSTHIGYLDLIEKIKKEREPDGMKFVQVTPRWDPPSPPDVPVAEVVAKQNDLEIIISKGVKVSISPNIDSMKIIKIIELLKDL